MDPDNPHRLAEARSLALHREVARVLRAHPEQLEQARARLERWASEGRMAPSYADAWREILAASIDEVVAAITDESPRARDLRQCSPFAGTLDPRTRWRILELLS